MTPVDRLLVAGAYRGPRKIAETTKIRRLDGRTATISVHEVGSLVSVRTNGKPDASLDRDQPQHARMSDELTQNFAAWVARAYLKKPWNGALIGLGSGMTSHRLLGDPRARHLDAIEIEKAMWIQAAAFRPFNRRAYEDPRHAMHFLDARIFFSTRTEPYDVIVSEPSNPWVAGVSSLFTTEFYREIRAHLTRDGVFVQWVHTYEFEDEMLLSILAALRTQFPHLRLHFIPTTQDMVIVASGRALEASDDNFQNPEDVAELSRFRMVPRDIPQGTLLWTEATVDRLLAGVVPNSEFLPVVDGRAEKAFYSKKHSHLVPRTLGGVWFPQELIPGEDFQARKAAVLDLRARQIADSSQVRLLLDWLEYRSPLNEARLQQILSGWAPATAPAWTWGLDPWRGVAESLMSSARGLGANTPSTALLRFQAFSNFGPEDSLDAARRDLIRKWPRHMNANDMRDLFLASIALGDQNSARFILEKQWGRVDTAITGIEYRFYEGLLKGKLQR
jgi:spermidine synthase